LHGASPDASPVTPPLHPPLLSTTDTAVSRPERQESSASMAHAGAKGQTGDRKVVAGQEKGEGRTMAVRPSPSARWRTDIIEVDLQQPPPPPPPKEGKKEGV